MDTLQLILNIIGLAEQGVTDFGTLKSQVEGFVAEGRDPTDAEWSAMLDDVDAQSAQLAAADKTA